jgi:3'-phosphoadenosine 5'-phosphosulfate sulfotransferase (PAPS reductase)/FAD synthetase
MKHVVTFSGGVGSWAAAKRVAERHGTADLTLLFTDVLMEDEDLYRFWAEAVVNVGGTPVSIADGRTPWQVFFDERFLGNSRIDPCSKILKRQPADRWLRDHCDPADTVVYVGVDWSESHRFERLRDRRALDGWRYEAPLCEPPYLTKSDVFAWLRREGIRVPRLYELGFAHNNCGGFCVKAGHGHFARLLRTMPERYAYHEQMEQKFRDEIAPEASILTDRTGDGRKKPLTLRQLRLRIQNQQATGNIDMFDIGGCGCFVDSDEDVAAKEAQ